MSIAQPLVPALTVTAVAAVVVAALVLAPPGASDGGAPDDGAREDARTAATSRVVGDFFDKVVTSMREAPQVRLARPASETTDPVEIVARAADRPDADLRPVSVSLTERTEHSTSDGVVRSCATWTTRYTTGPQSVTDTCWDLTVHGENVVAARPYGTDQIIAAHSAPADHR